MAQQSEAQNPIKTAEVTLAVLDGLTELNGADVTELAEHLGMWKSRVYNYLSILRQEEYVVKDGTTYDVGLQFVGIETYARQRKEIFDVAKPEMEALVKETGDLVNLLVEEHEKGVYFNREQGETAVKIDSYTRHRVHLHNTALGKAILADLPRERIDEIVDRHGLPATTENSITEREAVFEEPRSRIDRLVTEAIGQFNEQMEQILDLLEFENLERVWTERIETEVRDGRRKVRKPTFDVHVIRTTRTGSVYEDMVDHLSESEREVVGLLFAL
jgi:DNA-binding IclR family transcriptional regulator